MSLLHRFLVLFLLCVNSYCSLYEDDACFNTNRNGDSYGTCTAIHRCIWAIEQVKRYNRVDQCSFSEKTPIVCCPKNEVDRYPWYTRKRGEGEISSAKCRQFYPYEAESAFGGVQSLPKEFPHMAILGYGSDDNIHWRCGGSLINYRHVLTAAHCLDTRDLGKVKFVRLGDLDTSDNSDVADPQNFNVSRTFHHPDFDWASRRNDIAVIELDRNIKLTPFVKPACLHTGNIWPYDWEITATGWGYEDFHGELSNHLMKVKLKILDPFTCIRQYSDISTRTIIEIDNESQICAHSSDPSKIMDTCQGDSGGPLQIKNGSRYFIVGITSFGKACGLSASAGVYTRVSNYIPWIESVVWPNGV